jgi:hypothetical protein
MDEAGERPNFPDQAIAAGNFDNMQEFYEGTNRSRKAIKKLRWTVGRVAGRLAS